MSHDEHGACLTVAAARLLAELHHHFPAERAERFLVRLAEHECEVGGLTDERLRQLFPPRSVTPPDEGGAA